MGKNLLLVGGGHAHLTVLANLRLYQEAGHHVTLATPADYHYYSGMGPGLLSGHYAPRECRFNVRAMTERGGGTFIRSRMASIDPAQGVVHLENGMALGYDVCSFNTGSLPPPKVTGAGGHAGVFPVKPIENLLAAKLRLEEILARGRTPKVLVVGGGPAGVELAGNACELIRCGCAGSPEAAPDVAPDVAVVPGRGLLPRFPEKVRRLAYRSLAKRGIKIFDGHTASRLGDGVAYLSGDLRVPWDVAFIASGVAPQPDLSRFGVATGPKGGILVDQYLRSVSHPNILGGGDCISFAPGELEKVGVYPVRQNPVLHNNLLASLEEGELMPFTDTAGGYLLVLNCGGGRGILHKGFLTYEGQTAFWIKDRIDRAFMKRFQVSGELEEE